MNPAEQAPKTDFPLIRFFGMGSDADEIPALAEVGGKAINLCKLSLAKFPVPPGFVVTTAAYARFVSENRLGGRIAQLAASIDQGNAAAIDAGSAQIRALFSQHPMPPALAEEILRAYRLLVEPRLTSTRPNPRAPTATGVPRAAGSRTVPGSLPEGEGNFCPHPRAPTEGWSLPEGEGTLLAVAVRSSATAEDLPEASFAGQQDTYLNVRGEEALLKAVQSCWGSLWTARAVAYRAKQKTPAEGLAMAVVVEQMVMADAAGIMFTANPVSGARDEIVINAAWGLGEAIVGGEVTPDHIVVEKAGGKIKEITVSEKAAMTAITQSGTQQVALDDDRRRARVLGDDEVARLAEIGRQIELYYGAPQDIEWAVAAGQFAVLQARPIRGLEVAGDVEAGRAAEIERLAALAGGRRRIWVTHNLGETLRAPTPLTWDIVRRFMSGRGGFGRFYHDLGYRPSPQVCEEGFLELIGQRIYADPDRLAQLFWGDSPLQYDLQAVLGDNSLLDQAPTKFDSNKADGTFVLKLPGILGVMFRSWRISKRLRDTVRDHFEHAVLPPYLDYVRRKRGEDLTRLETPQVCAELSARSARVLDEFGKESLKPGFFGALAFSDLRRMLVQLLGDAEGGRLTSALTTGLEGDSTVAQNQLLYRVARGEAAMQEFLDAYGHRTAGEMELAEPRYREDPRGLDATLQAMRRSDRAPAEIHREHALRRAEVEKELPALLARWGGSSFREAIEKNIRQTQKLLAYRESGKHYLMLGYELVRTAILELARRWRLGREVFFLRLEELQHFEGRREELLEAAARRQVRWQSLQRLDMPDVIDSADLQQLGLPRQYERAAELKGDAVAAGVAAGTARVVFDPREARDLGAGYILVCPSTDPGWTPLFVNARGLVVERGGVLSHGAIVARDFGIPAVVCPGATSRIPDGSEVRLDGNRGLIHLLENA